MWVLILLRSLALPACLNMTEKACVGDQSFLHVSGAWRDFPGRSMIGKLRPLTVAGLKPPPSLPVRPRHLQALPLLPFCSNDGDSAGHAVCGLSDEMTGTSRLRSQMLCLEGTVPCMAATDPAKRLCPAGNQTGAAESGPQAG